MNWLLYGMLAFSGVCLLTAIALVWAGTDDERQNSNDDHIHFGQRGSSSSG
jgi:hypothetical protein